MIVLLVAVLCQWPAAGVCVNEIVADSDGGPLTLQGCAIQGQIGIADWMSRHPLYRTGWRLERYKCVIGGKDPRRST